MISEVLTKIHDLRLSAWGPYTKKYMGISHIADPKRGWRFDLSAMPGFYRRKVDIPSVLWESGYHSWEASPDLDYFCHRHELEWKDQVYCDIAFAKAGDSTRMLRCQCVNQTNSAQEIVLHLMASLQFPKEQPAVAIMPPEATWVDALDYATLKYAESRPLDEFASDLLLRGELRASGFVDGSGLSFNRSPGDCLSYRIRICKTIENAAVVIRYRTADKAQVRLESPVPVTLELAGGDAGFHSCPAILGRLEAGTCEIRLVSCGGSLLELDGFVVIDSDRMEEVSFEEEERNAHPELIPGPVENSLLLKYAGLDHYYGILWSFDNFRVREFMCDDLDVFLRHRVHDHVSKTLSDGGVGHFTDVTMHPIILAPHSTRTIYGLVCSGERDWVEKQLAAFDPSGRLCEAGVNAQRLKAIIPHGTPAGRAYEFSQARMSATTLANVVYPAYARRSFIKHNTPGRWWDSLYTWDSGFIGLGLLEMDQSRAIDCLNAYVTDPGDTHAAFAHHGSPVPVQHYLFLQLWNRTRSKELLAFFYPRLRQYHHFLSGRDERSNTRNMKSNLLQTWNYFYNSGGWDDYPPQQHLHSCGLAATTSPMVNTAHCIRTAKILRMAARELGETKDIADYEEDIAVFSQAIQAHAWDESSGYFGYVRHSLDGLPEGILKHQSGVNFNMGLDGMSPLISGICTPEQEARLVGHLRSDRELWTPIGLSTVDQSAPYYRHDGYWNGAVWMPHQWFMWKALLDLGESGLAFKIAETALKLWADEVGKSYNCCEHFTVQTGRGAGWHQFGGLSAPVLCWYSAYYVPGNLNGGLDVWVDTQEFSNHNESLRASLRLDRDSSKPISLVAVMNPGNRYRAFWNGAEIEGRELNPGTLDLRFHTGGEQGLLEITPV